MRSSSTMSRAEWKAQQAEKSYQSYLKIYNEQKSKGYSMQKVQVKGGGFEEKPLSKAAFIGVANNLKALDNPPKNMAREIAMSQRVLSTRTSQNIERRFKSEIEAIEKREKETFAEKVASFKASNPGSPLPKRLERFKPSAELEERRRTFEGLKGAKGLASMEDEKRRDLFDDLLKMEGFSEDLKPEEKTRVYRAAESLMYPEDAKRRNISRR